MEVTKYLFIFGVIVLWNSVVAESDRNNRQFFFTTRVPLIHRIRDRLTSIIVHNFGHLAQHQQHLHNQYHNHLNSVHNIFRTSPLPPTVNATIPTIQESTQEQTTEAPRTETPASSAAPVFTSSILSTSSAMPTTLAPPTTLEPTTTSSPPASSSSPPTTSMAVQETTTLSPQRLSQTVSVPSFLTSSVLIDNPSPTTQNLVQTTSNSPLPTTTQSTSSSTSPTSSVTLPTTQSTTSSTSRTSTETLPTTQSTTSSTPRTSTATLPTTQSTTSSTPRTSTATLPTIPSTISSTSSTSSMPLTEPTTQKNEAMTTKKPDSTTQIVTATTRITETTSSKPPLKDPCANRTVLYANSMKLITLCYINQSLSWTEAREKCLSLNYRLFEVNSYLKEVSAFNFYKNFATNNEFRWINGVAESVDGIANWYTVDPHRPLNYTSNSWNGLTAPVPGFCMGIVFVGGASKLAQKNCQSFHSTFWCEY